MQVLPGPRFELRSVSAIRPLNSEKPTCDAQRALSALGARAFLMKNWDRIEEITERISRTQAATVNHVPKL